MTVLSQLLRGVLFLAFGSLLAWGGLVLFGSIDLGKAPVSVVVTQLDRMLQTFLSYSPTTITVLALCLIGVSSLAIGTRTILRSVPSRKAGG